MARALLGHVGSSNSQVLAHEVMRLRRRVAELESEIERLRVERGELAHPLDLELHELADATAPALA